MFIILAIFLALAAGLVYLFVQFVIYFFYFCLAAALLLVVIFTAGGMSQDIVGFVVAAIFAGAFLWIMSLGNDDKPPQNHRRDPF